jgi:hypothetical protein
MFDATDIANMRSCQVLHMMDTAVLQTYTTHVNSFNEDDPTYVDAATSHSGGLDMRPGSERHGQNYTLLEFDASWRVPVNFSFNVRDRIKVTKRLGETLAIPLIFEIVGPQQLGPSAARLLLKRVEA